MEAHHFISAENYFQAQIFEMFLFHMSTFYSIIYNQCLP